MDLASRIDRQRDWSAATFGPAFRRGTIEHLIKECDEIERDPDDVTEWTDALILSMDGAWRSGHSPEDIEREVKQALRFFKSGGPEWCLRRLRLMADELKRRDPLSLVGWSVCAASAIAGALTVVNSLDDVVAALDEKQAKNMARVWPDWRGKRSDEAIEHDRANDLPTPISSQASMLTDD